MDSYENRWREKTGRATQRFVIPGMIILGLTLAGCAATVTALKYKDLEVQTKMSETIFLDPVAPEKKTIWIEIKNTTDQELDLSHLNSLIAARGYRVTTDPEAAHYRLQINTLFVGKASRAAIDESIAAGFGGPLAGALIGAGAGAAIGGSPTAVGVGAGIGGLLGAGAELVTGSLVKAVTYTAITDVQLSEHSNTPIAQQQYSTLSQGTQTQVHQQVGETTHWKRYRNRVASTATKVNLDFEEARPALVDRLMKSLAGLL